MHDDADADADAVAVARAVAVTLTLADENVVAMHVSHPWKTRALRDACSCWCSTASMALSTNARSLAQGGAQPFARL